MIDTYVPGNPGDVRAAALWLRSGLSNAVDSAAEDAQQARQAAHAWEGDAAEAYAAYAKTVVAAADAHRARVDKAAVVFELYASRLQSALDRMSALRSQASGGGLVVSDTRILPPSAPDTADDQATVDGVNHRVALYNRLAGDCVAEQESFTQWVSSHLRPAADDAEDAPDVTKVVSGVIAALGPFLLAAGIQFGEDRVIPQAARRLRQTGQLLSDTADYNRAAKRSGNPARRVTYDPEMVKQLARDAENLKGSSRLLLHGGKLLGPLGIGVDVYSGYQEYESGESSAGRTIFKTSTGIAAGGATAFVLSPLATTGVGAIFVAGASAGAASAGNWAGGETWDNTAETKDGIVESFKNWAVGTVRFH